MRLKIDLYRRMARLSTMEEWEDLAAELVDRFGPRPAEVERMLLLAKLRIWAHFWQIESIHLEEGYMVFRYSARRRIEQLAQISAGRLRIVDNKSAYFPLGKDVMESDQITGLVESLLRPQ
jgi:transcription-repair coupling factor (superfamily II helicase)